MCLAEIALNLRATGDGRPYGVCDNGVRRSAACRARCMYRAEISLNLRATGDGRPYAVRDNGVRRGAACCARCMYRADFSVYKKMNR